MPIQKWNFNEIRKGVVMEIEGKQALEIAKSLTADYLAQLCEQEEVSKETKKRLLRINEARGQLDSIQSISNEMGEVLKTNHPDAIKEVKGLIVHPKRVRDMMQSNLWKEFRIEFEKEHIKLIAQAEARKHVESKQASKGV